MQRGFLMTVLEIIDNARDLLKAPLSESRGFPDNSSSDFKDDTLLRYLNDEQQVIYNHIVNAQESYFITQTTINLVNDTADYLLPTAINKIVRLENYEDSASPFELIPISINDYDFINNLTVGNSTGGDVAYYTIKGNYLTIYPTPQENITDGLQLYYVKFLTDLTLETQTPEIPRNWQELLIWGIVKRAMFQQEGSKDSYEVAVLEYSNLIKDLKKHIENRQIQRSRQVKRKRGY